MGLFVCMLNLSNLSNQIGDLGQQLLSEIPIIPKKKFLQTNAQLGCSRYDISFVVDLESSVTLLDSFGI